MAKRDGKGGRKYEQDSHQWYVEPPFTDEQVCQSIDLGGGVVWDPCCGKGTTLDAAKASGHVTFGSDLVNRGARHQFRQLDFLKAKALPFRPLIDKPVSILTNPPYGRVGNVQNMGEEIVKHALRHFAESCYRMAFILPIEFQCGQDRYWQIYERNRPSHVLICCERPSMPPGHKIEELGDKAFRGGMADYCVIVWTGPHSERTETIFMRPRDLTRPPTTARRIK